MVEPTILKKSVRQSGSSISPKKCWMKISKNLPCHPCNLLETKKIKSLFRSKSRSKDSGLRGKNFCLEFMMSCLLGDEVAKELRCCGSAASCGQLWVRWVSFLQKATVKSPNSQGSMVDLPTFGCEFLWYKLVNVGKYTIYIEHLGLHTQILSTYKSTQYCSQQRCEVVRYILSQSQPATSCCCHSLSCPVFYHANILSTNKRFHESMNPKKSNSQESSNSSINFRPLKKKTQTPAILLVTFFRDSEFTWPEVIC